MKAVILAGGLGTRIAEESRHKPKPMVEIGGMPILWHIMKIYSVHGVNDFVVCAGYKQEVIKDWFANYYLHTHDVTFDFSTKGYVTEGGGGSERWKVTVVDTGLMTQTGGRVKRIRDYVGDEDFFLTYGDAVGDIDIGALYAFHKSHGCLGTVSVYNFGQSKGVLEIGSESEVKAFREKSDIDGDLINIGFMVFKPEFLDLIDGDDTILEQEPMRRLVEASQLKAYVHKGFWQCMDTLKEKERLQSFWASGNAPWKIWD